MCTLVKAELELKMEKALKETRPEKWGKVQGYNKKAMVYRPPPPFTLPRHPPSISSPFYHQITVFDTVEQKNIFWKIE